MLHAHKVKLDVGTLKEFVGLGRLAMGDENRLNLLKCSDYDGFSPVAIRLFTHLTARYLLPTVELVEYLKAFIGDKKAIEIGSGAGDLARFLGIPATDNYCQDWPEMAAFYDATSQPRIQYGSNVERLDALDAVRKYKPDIVIGAWVTQWIDPNLPFPLEGGSMYGIKEEEVLELAPMYVMIGAQGIHWGKKILQQPHDTFNAERIARSRRQDNRIWTWGEANA